VPLWQIPQNFVLAVSFILFMILHPARRKLDAARHASGLRGSVLEPAFQGARFTILPSLPKLEYPHIPNLRTLFAGPILSPELPLSADSFPDYFTFLAGGRTAPINLGSLFKFATQDVRALARGLVTARNLLEERGGLRVLWKLPGVSNYASLLDEELGSEAQRQEWLRIEEWIEPPALALLQHFNLVVSVHHGGASESSSLSPANVQH
jgi:hypothetical protein